MVVSAAAEGSPEVVVDDVETEVEPDVEPEVEPQIEPQIEPQVEPQVLLLKPLINTDEKQFQITKRNYICHKNIR